MKKIGLLLTGVAAMVFGTMAMAFDAYFSDAAGTKIGLVWEGQYVYIAVKDPDKGACGIDQFPADLVIFDFKTGAYIWVEDDPNTPDYEGAWFRELGGIGSGLYFWVDAPGSNSKVGVQIGSRANFANVPYGHTHVLGNVVPAPVVPPALSGAPAGQWEEGAWEYVDENVLSGDPAAFAGVNTGFAAFPRQQLTARVDFEGLGAGVLVDPREIAGRLENNDTLILIVSDATDPRNIDQDQIKIRDTVSKLTVTPANIRYGCAPACQNIIVRIEDKDENLNCNEIEYVPFFVIVNPGSWTPANSAINNFCALMLRGSFDNAGLTPDLELPIRWYNIYDEPVVASGIPSRWLEYPPEWLSGAFTIVGIPVGRALFFARETAVDSGVFEFNFGNIEELQATLGFGPFPAGTTIAFYYIDPNDFDDMDLATIAVAERSHSQVFITDASGISLSEVKIGWGGLHIRVYDADANVNACCQDRVVVHICDPHNEDDSEYIIIDEISNNSGIFFTQSGIPLLPVWDAISGYQLVFDDWKVQAFNEDTIFVRYNSVDYVEADLGLLGDGNANDGAFPPSINAAAARNQVWDVSFAKAKVYDFQVFDGTTHRMQFLDGEYRPITKSVPMAGQLYLEVTDLDQNENPLLRELIFGGWNRDAAADALGRTHQPRYNGPFGLPDPATLSEDAGEDSAPIWWLSFRGELPPPPEEQPPAPPEEPGPPAPPEGLGDSDIMSPAGMVENTAATPFVNPYLGGPQWPIRGTDDVSFTGVLETVKVFIWNAQNGNWERVDLRETGISTGIFRSTTCVLVSDDRHPGDGNLGSKPGDTIMAFYQDPSNHSDISIISIKVSEGGAGEVVPPVVKLEVAFDRAQYYPGDAVTITVTDEQYAGAAEIVGTNVLVLLDKDGGLIESWNRIEVLAGQPGKFRVTTTLPETVKLGTITAKYTDPMTPTRVAQGTATVVAKALANVTGITVSPNPFKTSTTFSIVAEPAGALAQKITIAIYDLTGAKVAVLEGQNTASVTWNGGNLGNGAYIYVATVEGAGKVFGPFKGFVYIER